MSRRARLRAEAERRRKRKRVTIIGAVAGVAIVAALLVVLRPWGSADVAAGAVWTSPDQVHRINPREAKELIDKGEAALYDVRARAAYEASHAAGAIALPEDELVSLISTLPPSGKLIFYCT